MDLARVELYVLRCPLQELEFRHVSGVYLLGNVPTKPAWWSVGYQAPGQMLWDWYTCRGLRTVITLIEQTYPELYAWLVFRFPGEGYKEEE
ncbi:MAG: hypothetical protein ACR2H5_25555 [Ktedonobacteraceae bacterium]